MTDFIYSSRTALRIIALPPCWMAPRTENGMKLSPNLCSSTTASVVVLFGRLLDIHRFLHPTQTMRRQSRRPGSNKVFNAAWRHNNEIVVDGAVGSSDMFVSTRCSRPRSFVKIWPFCASAVVSNTLCLSCKFSDRQLALILQTHST